MAGTSGAAHEPAAPAAESTGAGTSGVTLDWLEAWLDEHPDASVGALGADALPQPLSPEIRLGPRHTVDNRSMVDFIYPADRPAVAAALATAGREGKGTATARLADDPAQTVVVNYVDLRPQVPTFVRLITAARETKSAPEVPTQLVGRPRVGIIVKDEAARIVDIDGGVAGLLGWRLDDVVGHSTLDFIHPEDHLRATENWWSMHLGSGRQSVRLRYHRVDGSWVWLETSNGLDTDTRGEPIVLCQVIDVSEEMAATEALRRNEQLLRRLTETVPVGLCLVTPGHEVTTLNPRLATLLEGRDVPDLAALDGVLHTERAGALREVVADALEQARDGELDVTLERRNGETLRCRVTLSAVVDEGTVIGVLLCAVDVTELQTQASLDALTGLHNRRSILLLLREVLAAGHDRTGVLFLDLDGFKQVNDVHGHAAGDLLLIAVADRLRATVRTDDVIGRLGGDEFLVVCPALASARELDAIAARAAAALARPIVVGGVPLSITASIGTTVTSTHGDQGAEDLVSLADADMYARKKLRRGAGSAPPAPTRRRAVRSSR